MALSKGIVLIIEDDDLMRKALVRMTLRLGYQPLTLEASVRDLVMLAVACRPVAAVVDVHLPGGADGRRIVTQARLQIPLSVVFVTGDHVAAGDQKIDAHTRMLQKPLNQEDLREALSYFKGNGGS